MCLAIYKPAGIEIPLKYLENGFGNHSDGAGMAWAVDGVLYTRKGMFKVEEVLEQYEKIKQYPALIHFRKATHGKVDAMNCHPFLFNDNKLALIHNGILPIKCCIDGLSDTAHFVKLVLEPMVKLHKVPINDGALNYLICTSIGSDKIAIMDNDGQTFIFNEDKGTWDENVWYSNTSFRFTYSSYKASDSTSTQKWNNHPHFSYKGSSDAVNTPDRKHSDWKKHWTADDAEDENYLAFWKRTAASHSANKQKTPLLLSDANGQVDDAGNVTTTVEAPKYSEGQMCEYGWFDTEIETDIEIHQTNLNITREEALIRVFNER